MPDWERLADGEAIVFDKDINEAYIACCDCGLTHKYRVVHDDGDILMRVYRQPEMTKQHRKESGIKVIVEAENVEGD